MNFKYFEPFLAEALRAQLFPLKQVILGKKNQQFYVNLYIKKTCLSAKTPERLNKTMKNAISSFRMYSVNHGGAFCTKGTFTL